MSWSVVFFVPAVILVALVLPIWLILHYREKSRVESGLSATDRVDLEEMATAAERMAARIAALEAILDSEIQGWRGRVDPQGDGETRGAERRGGQY